MLEVVIPTFEFNNNPEAISFIDYLKTNAEKLKLDEATIYYNYPLFREFDEGVHAPSFFIISPFHGIVIMNFDKRDERTLNEKLMEEAIEDLDYIFSHILSKLIKIPSLRKKRSRSELQINMETLLYLPNYDRDLEEKFSDLTYIVKTEPELFNTLNSLQCERIDTSILTDIYSVIDGTRAIPRPTKREIEIEDTSSKGSKISDLELQIAKFDQKQKMAALTIIDGPQRVRGMAGSGKTIILAMKAALIHIDNPNAKILYTFYTKSLYDQIKQLITRFYRMHEDHDPNWDNIQILHAWGGVSLPGVYYNACIENGMSPMPFRTATSLAQSAGENTFGHICKDLLDRTNGKIRAKYDYILMDEGQDFSESFYWLCRKLVVNDRLVWAYDELQNILDIDLQETLVLFKNKYGDEGIDLPLLMANHPHQNNDIVLHKSYRNPIEILLVAHAIGFGLYNNPIIQILENEGHWNDLGYNVIQGNCSEGENTVIERPESNSPSGISEFYSPDEIIQISHFQNWDEEIHYVCETVSEAISDKLLPEDIMIICIDDQYARRYFDRIQKVLAEKHIFTNNILTSYSGDNFIVKGKVTLTTVYRAKGNEAAMVFVMGVDSLAYKQNDIIGRNKLFTAFTRSKAWLKISGVGQASTYIDNEINKAKSLIPKFEFKYPNIAEIKTHRRELAKQNEELNRKREQLLANLDELGLDTETAMKLLKGETDL